MTHADESREDDQDRSQGQQRGGSASAIANALHRTPHPGPQHWGGPRPRREVYDPFRDRLPRPPRTRPA